MHPLLQNPWVAAQIDAVAARYRHLWTDEQLHAFREQMAETLATNPNAARLLRDAHPSVVDESGSVPLAGSELDPALETTGDDIGGAPRRSAG
jgi:hypothetical protein